MSTFLLIIGGLCQVLGVFMVVVSLRSTLTALARYESRGTVVFGNAAMGIATALGARVVVEPPPPLDARVLALEQRVDQLPDQIREEIASERNRTRDEIAGRIDAVTKSYKLDFENLSKLTTDSLRGAKWPTYIGAVLIALGVLLASWGSVIA